MHVCKQIVQGAVNSYTELTIVYTVSHKMYCTVQQSRRILTECNKIRGAAVDEF